VKKVLDTKIDNPELSKSLVELSNIYPQNSAASRRGLRANIEKQGLKINDEFLQVAEAAQAALEEVEKQLEGLASCCACIGSSIEATRNSTSELAAETSKLKKELADCESRSELVGSFLQDYQLSTDEVLALREGEVDEVFFTSLEHVKDIHKNCKLLLRTHHQRAGLELMDVMAMHQETAYERLCRWVQTECRSLGDSDTPEVSPYLKRASGTLRGRPVLFKYCAEEVANQRHNALFRRFIAALTRGGPGGMPRPMEIHAHDPRRYVGDMLAWLHQALASEHELMHSLFGVDADSEAPGGAGGVARDAGARTFEEEEEIWDTPTILDKVFEGVCRPFKVRVEQVLTTVPGTIAPSLLLTFRVGALLNFYLQTVGHFIKPEAALSTTITECKDLAQRTFYDILKAKGDKLVRHPPVPAKDLAPPAACSSSVHQLIELLESPDFSMVDTETRDEFQPILDAIIDPLVTMCSKSADLLRDTQQLEGDSPPSPSIAANGSPSWGSLVFQINCLMAVLQPLAAYPATASKCEHLKKLVEGFVHEMVQAEGQRILQACGLADKLGLIKMYTEGDDTPNQSVMSLDPSLSLVLVSAAMNALFTSLSNSEDNGMPEFELLQVPKVRLDATSRLAAMLTDAYSYVYNTLMDPTNGYDDATGMLKHTPAQMKTICGL